MSETIEPLSYQDLLRLKCAYLSAQGMKQGDIAQALGPNISQPAISKMLKEARIRNELQQQVVWPVGTDAEQRRAIEQAILPKDERDELTRVLDSWRRDGATPRVGDVHIVYAGDMGKVGDDGEEASDPSVFGRNAAPLIAQMFENAEVCAVAWGETIRAIVAAIGPHAKSLPDLQFLPLCGQPLNHHTDSAINSSAASQELSELFKTDPSARYSLHGVPARIPKGLGGELEASLPEGTDFDEQEAVNSVMRSFVDTCADYRTIFGGDSPMISQADMILTSIGDIAGKENDPLYLDMKESERVENDDDLRSITSGNICGAWLPADPNNPRHVEQVAGVNDRWLGIKQEQISQCAMRAALDEHSSSPGVVVVAAAPKQAKIIRQAVGMINTLVISPDLARALIRLGPGSA